jgi:hypothetical protein
LIDLDFNGGSGDEWHVDNCSNGERRGGTGFASYVGYAVRDGRGGTGFASVLQTPHRRGEVHLPVARASRSGDLRSRISARSGDLRRAGLTATDSGYTDKADSGTTCHSWDHDGTAGGPVCIVESATEHEDWPSLVDAALAMMQDEAETGEDNGGSETGGDDDTDCGNCVVTNDGSITEGGGSENTEPPVTEVPGVFGGAIYLNDAYFRNNPFGVPCIVCHGVTAQGVVGPANSFRFPGGPGSLEYYLNLRDTVSSGAVGTGIALAGFTGGVALQATIPEVLSIVVIEEHVAGVVFFQQTLGGAIAECAAGSVTAVPILLTAGGVTLVFAYPVQAVSLGYLIINFLDPSPVSLKP